MVHQAMLSLNVNEQVDFEVSFCSDKPLTVKAKILLQVEDNHYGTTVIRVSGEVYQEIVTLHNIKKSSQEVDDEEGKTKKNTKKSMRLLM